MGLCSSAGTKAIACSGPAQMFNTDLREAAGARSSVLWKTLGRSGVPDPLGWARRVSRGPGWVSLYPFPAPGLPPFPPFYSSIPLRPSFIISLSFLPLSSRLPVRSKAAPESDRRSRRERFNDSSDSGRSSTGRHATSPGPDTRVQLTFDGSIPS